MKTAYRIAPVAGMLALLTLAACGGGGGGDASSGPYPTPPRPAT